MDKIKSLLKNRIIQLILLAILLLAIPLGVYLAQQQQKIKSRAASAGTAQLSLEDSSRNDLQVNGTFTVDLVLTLQEGGSASAVDATINFNNQLLRMESFANPSGGSKFSNVLMPTIVDTIRNDQGSFRYLAIDKTSSVISGRVVLGRMTFKVNAAGSSNITFADNSRYTIQTDRKLFIPITTASGTYSTVGASPSPSPSPGVSPSPVVVACSSVSIDGLTRSSGDNSRDNGPVYNLTWRGPATKNAALIITRTPTTAEISLSTGSITKSPATAPDIGITTYGGDITLNFPANNTTAEYIYEIQTRVSVGTTSANCRIAEVRMPGVVSSPSPSPSPGSSPSPSPSSSPAPRIRGDAAVTGDRCVDYRDYSEWLLEYTSRSSRQDADWAGGTTDIGGGIKPDGQVTPLDRDAWLEECLYGQHFCPNTKCYE